MAIGSWTQPGYMLMVQPNRFVARVAAVSQDLPSSKIMAQLDLKDAAIDTKAHPGSGGGHASSQLRSSLLTSLKSLGRDKVRVLYLHVPDKTVPFEETLEEVHKLHQEARYSGSVTTQLGRSQKSSESAKLGGGYRPKFIKRVYALDGFRSLTLTSSIRMYNAITREIEPELIPCARKFGIRVVIYNPLAGGFFAGKVTSVESSVEGRFDPKGGILAELYRARYLKSGYFDALEHLKTIVSEHKLRLTEIALRWCQHHSALTPEDGIILGASSAEQLKQNCEDSAKGPLPEPVVKALDEAYQMVIASGSVPRYWR
ncbi:hypothetical protein V5O48_001739 [Marasmius crinis-equi]|uniref:NADP-dependent oxidoreductase domain-containing protein n=1 Tax=Marasmius crinis-equi TaxID=585013 RepID=A0ABR3FYN0_9AGAR